MHRPQQPIAVLDAPSNLGLRPPAPGRVPGVAQLPDALRRTDVVARLGATDAGRVAAPAYVAEVDRHIGIRNWQGIRRFTFDLADRVGALLDDGAWPLLLGGDCSILLGPALSLRRRGRFGLVFIDGHLDLLLPQTSRTAGAAGMDLALVTGHGPAELADLDNLAPLIQPQDVAVFGVRDPERPAPGPILDLLDTGVLAVYDLSHLRRLGIAPATAEVLSGLARPDLDGFWIHLDADVLDDAVMPAVDSRQPGGLSYAELVEALRLLLGSGRAVGLEITILDPDLDPDGTIVRAFADATTAAFAGGAPSIPEADPTSERSANLS